MHLIQYVSKVVINGEYTDSFPECLYIPKLFVDYCYNLYTAGEKQKKELGVTISWDKKGELKIGDKVTEGTQTGITLPNVDDDSYFGDLHCHPSSSIGHKNGYAAHSPEDVYSMRYNKNKPLFLRFVCSNKKIYLMAYRNNYSEIVEKTIFDIGQRNSDIAADYFNTNCPLNKAERNELMLKYEGPEFNEQMNNLRRNTPGLGEEMERLSIVGGKEIALSCKLGFYAGDQGDGLSVLADDYLKICLMK